MVANFGSSAIIPEEPKLFLKGKGVILSYQELQYLRDELNQRVSLNLEHGNKAINMVLIAWGTVLAIFGVSGGKSMDISAENAMLYFMLATFFFISNMGISKKGDNFR